MMNPSKRTGQSILLVEDEAPIRLLMWHILTRAKYQVSLATDGIDGIRKLRELNRVDLLLTDLAMPGLSGVQLAQEARVIHPDIKVIYATGSQDCFPEFREDICCVLKPFTVEELLNAVSQALGAFDINFKPIGAEVNIETNTSCFFLPQELAFPLYED